MSIEQGSIQQNIPLDHFKDKIVNKFLLGLIYCSVQHCNVLRINIKYFRCQTTDSHTLRPDRRPYSIPGSSRYGAEDMLLGACSKIPGQRTTFVHYDMHIGGKWK